MTSAMLLQKKDRYTDEFESNIQLRRSQEDLLLEKKCPTNLLIHVVHLTICTLLLAQKEILTNLKFKLKS